FVDGGDYAVYDSGGFVRAMTAGAGLSDYATTVTSNRHVKISATVLAQPTVTIKTLNLAGPTVGFDILAGSTVTLTNGGIIKSGGGSSSITGSSTIVSSSSELMINTVAATDQLTVAVVISGGPGLTKTGAGTLILGSSGDNYSGD